MTGKNPLGNGREPQSYEGLNVLVPLGGWQFVRAKRDPTTNDKKYPVGTIWLNTVAANIWMLVAGGGTWDQIESIGSGGTLVVANGGTGATTFTSNGVLIGNGTSPITATSAGATGTVLAGNTGSAPTFQLIPALNVVDTTTTTQAMAANTTYIADHASAQVVFTLPATAPQGSEISISGNGPGGWQIAQNANQVIKMNASSTTTGTGGTLTTTNRYNSITLLATVGGASTTWVVNDFSGSFTFV